MNPGIYPKGTSKVGNSIGGVLRSLRSLRPSRSYGTMTSYTTEGVRRRSKPSEDRPAQQTSNVPRWG